MTIPIELLGFLGGLTIALLGAWHNLSRGMGDLKAHVALLEGKIEGLSSRLVDHMRTGEHDFR